jgi:hypothetical protein
VPAVGDDADDSSEVLGGLRAAGGLDALDLIAAGAAPAARRGVDGGNSSADGSGSVPAVAVDPGLASTRLGPSPGRSTRPGGGGGGAGLVRELSDDLVEEEGPGGGDGGGGDGGPSGGFRDVAL